MPEWVWSYLLVGVGLAGFILAGQKVWWCWYVNFFCQFLWLAYAVITQQWGFIVGALVYAIVFGRNAVKWTNDIRRNKKVMPARIDQTLGHVTNVEVVDEGLLVHGRFTETKANKVVYADADGVVSVGDFVPVGHTRVGSFYQEH